MGQTHHKPPFFDTGFTTGQATVTLAGVDGAAWAKQRGHVDIHVEYYKEIGEQVR